MANLRKTKTTLSHRCLQTVNISIDSISCVVMSILNAIRSGCFTSSLSKAKAELHNPVSRSVSSNKQTGRWGNMDRFISIYLLIGATNVTTKRTWFRNWVPHVSGPVYIDHV